MKHALLYLRYGTDAILTIHAAWDWNAHKTTLGFWSRWKRAPPYTRMYMYMLFRKWSERSYSMRCGT
jgi:hypothetical protein